MKLYHASSFLVRELILNEGLKPSTNDRLNYENAIFFTKEGYKPLYYHAESDIVDVYEVTIPDEYISKVEKDNRSSDFEGAVVIYFDNPDVRLTNIKLIETRFYIDEMSENEVIEYARKMRAIYKKLDENQRLAKLESLNNTPYQV